MKIKKLVKIFIGLLTFLSVLEGRNKGEGMEEFIYKKLPKTLYSSDLFYQLQTEWSKKDADKLKTSIRNLNQNTTYGILKFNKSDGAGLSKNELRYQESVWIIIASPEIHSTDFLFFVDLKQDGYLYTGADLDMDQVGIIGMDYFRLLDENDGLEIRDDQVTFNLPSDPKNPSKFKNYTITHNREDSDYYNYYKNAVNCVNRPFRFRQFNENEPVLIGAACEEKHYILSRPIVAGSMSQGMNEKNTSLPEGKLLLPALTINTDGSTNVITNSSPFDKESKLKKKVDTPFAKYEKIICSGVGPVNHKCVIIPPEEWKPLIGNKK